MGAYLPPGPWMEQQGAELWGPGRLSQGPHREKQAVGRAWLCATPAHTLPGWPGTLTSLQPGRGWEPVLPEVDAPAGMGHEIQLQVGLGI